LSSAASVVLIDLAAIVEYLPLRGAALAILRWTIRRAPENRSAARFPVVLVRTGFNLLKVANQKVESAICARGDSVYALAARVQMSKLGTPRAPFPEFVTAHAPAKIRHRRE
jgi:hypothetical protein